MTDPLIDAATITAAILGDSRAMAAVERARSEAGHAFGPASLGRITCAQCGRVVTEASLLLGFTTCPNKPATQETTSERLWQVWSEGYAINSERGQAQLIGSANAPTFALACQIVMTAAESVGKDYGRFDPERLTVWGCRLFPTEVEARAGFG